MDPRQHDVRRHRTDRDCLVLDVGNVVVGWPVVGHQPGVGATAPSTKAWIWFLPKPSITFSRARRGVPPSTSTAPATSILLTPLRPAGTTIGSFLARNGMIVSSASTTPLSGSRSGLTMARRILAHNIQAVRYEPRPSWLCSCSAEMPLECVAMRNAAQNQIVSGGAMHAADGVM